MNAIKPTKTASLDQADSLLVDSHLALEYARNLGLNSTAKIFSASPALVSVEDVVPLETSVNSQVIQRLSKLIGEMSRQVYEIVSIDSFAASRAVTFARAAPNIENLAYKAWLLSRVRLGDSIALVEHPPVVPSLKSGWARLLSKLPEFHIKIEVPTHLLPKVLSGHHTVPPINIRLRFETWQSIAFRLFIKLPVWLKKVFFKQGDVLVVSENGLIKESGAYLGLKGFRLRRLPSPPRNQQVHTLPKDLAIKLGKLVENTFANEFSNSSFLRALALAYIEACEEALGEYHNALKHWQKQLALFEKSKKVFVVSNFNATPTGEALFELCQAKSIHYICSQHGTGVELAAVGQHSYQYGEAANSSIYFTYNDESAKLNTSFEATRAEIISVGQPRDLADVGRHIRGSGPIADIYYVSNQALFGYVLPPSSAGISEMEAVAWESSIITEVLARLPHRVVYKPYRSMFYLDQSPLHLCADANPNIYCYKGFLDLRYMLPNARVLVMTHASSTLSWCLMSKKPVVYINAPEQSLLNPEFESGMKKGCIVVDADDPEFLDKLHKVLSQPIEAIEAEWKRKEKARNHILEQFIGKTDGKAGKRMANTILKHVNANFTPCV